MHQAMAISLANVLYVIYETSDDAAQVLTYIVGLLKDDPAPDFRIAEARSMANLSIILVRTHRNTGGNQHL